MREYILLLPLIFIFHDMGELAGFGWLCYLRSNQFLHPDTMRVADER